MKIYIRFALTLWLFVLFIPDIHAQPLFEVERESFCKALHEREPIDPLTGIAEITRGEGIFLWMEIKAGGRALTMLESKGKMPIYHAWASDAGVTDRIDIGITRERWMELSSVIKNQFKSQGFFTWRTQSFKRHFREGRWYVSVLDANRKPIRKSDSGQEAFRPEIIIKFIP